MGLFAPVKSLVFHCRIEKSRDNRALRKNWGLEGVGHDRGVEWWWWGA